VKGPPARHTEEREYPALEGTISSAAELAPGDRVVYPNQGVCRVAGLEQRDIAGQRLELMRMTREEDGASVMVPMNKVSSIGLRRVASADQMEGVFHYLGATSGDPELDWKVRHRDNVERLIAGGVLGVAEVVKGLHSLSRIRPLPTKEREQYDNARHLLVNEVAVSLGVPPGLAEDYVDYALLPPAGVKLQLKPPPKPVVLTVPLYRRKKPAPVTEEEDLGLAELGLDLGALTEGGAEVGGAVPAEGEEAEEPKPVKGAQAKAPKAATKAPAARKALARAGKPGARKAPPRKAGAKKVAARKAAPKKATRAGKKK
jgi:RNA polymerase-interacting CarD/CdnL/TRCF family regulator